MKNLAQKRLHASEGSDALAWGTFAK